MSVLSEASHRVLMAFHRTEVLSGFEFVNLDSLAVASDDNVTIFVLQLIVCVYLLAHAVVDVCIFEVIDAKDLI